MCAEMDANRFSRLQENYLKKMFSVLLIIAYLTSFGFTHESLNDRNDILMETLHSAALEVISLHSNSFDEIDEDLSLQESIDEEKSREKRSVPFLNIPHLDTSTNFMHSYISETGVGNREEMIIERIQEERLQVNVPSLIRGWNYLRFNSTDFVMAYQDFHLDVWRMSLTSDIEDEGLNFDHRYAYCSIDMNSEGRITNAMFYTKLIKHMEVLFFAVTIESPKSSQMRAYEVTYVECVSIMQLNFHNSRPIRMSFVSSQYQSALVVLFNSNQRSTQLIIKRINHDEYHKVIEVYVKDAIDLETFTINGFGYIAVANRFGCEVYRLSEFIEHHLQFNSINIPGIIDLKAFRLGFDHFLGLATLTDHQYLYVWHSGSFHLKQKLNVNSVMKWNTIYMPTCRDDVLIYLLRYKSSAQIYRWNGQMRDFQLAVHDVNKMMSKNYEVLPHSLAEFSYNHTAYVLQVDTYGKSHLISFHTRLEVVPDPELLRGLQITDLMHKLKDRFIFQQTYLQKISDSLKYAIRPNANKIIGTDDLIKNLQVLNGVTVDQIKVLTNIIWQNSPLTVHDLKYSIKYLKNNIDGIAQRLNRVIEASNDVVLRNKPAIITGHKRFIGHNEISSLNASLLNINTIGRQNLKLVLNNLYRISRPQIIKGIKHIVRPILVKGSMSTIFTNGIDLNKQIVTSDEPQMITGNISYNSQLTVVNDLIIRGKLNNFNLSKDLVFLNNPDIIYAPKIFTSPVIIAQSVNALYIDGIDLRLLFNNVLLSSGSQTMNSQLTLVKPLTANTIEVDGQVNGIDISAMANQLVYKNRPVLVKGKKKFILEDFHVKNNLFVVNKIDGHSIPYDFFTRTGNQIITGPKTFKRVTRFDDPVVVNGLIDGLRLPQDIVRLSLNETIFGPIIFGQSIISNKKIDVHHLVDGVDLSELNLYSLKLNDKMIRSDVRFNRAVTVGVIDLNGIVNGINLDYLYKEAIFKGSPHVEIRGTKLFKTHVEFPQLFVERLNGQNINDFVSTTKNETIYAQKHFATFTSFNTISVKGLIDKVNIDNLFNNSLSLSKPERITGTKNFLEQITTDSISVGKKINGILPQVDIVLKSKFQEINGTKIFNRNLNVQNLKSRNSLSLKGKVDNILINDLNSRVVKLNSHKSIPLHVVLMSCNASTVEVYRNINGINISDFANNVMSLTKPQVIYSLKTFKNDQHFSHIMSSKGVNGLSLKALNAEAVHLNGFSQIRAPFTFANNIRFQNPIVMNGVVNGVNLSYIARDSVYKTGPNLISGYNVFKSGFQVRGDIKANRLNGIDLSNELLTNIRDHTIRGKVKFTKSLNISNSVMISGRINGLDLSEFNKKVMKTNNKNLITGNLEMTGPIKVLSNLNIAGKLNGINLNNFFSDVLFFNGNQEIHGLKTMSSVQFLNQLNTSIINGINIPQALKEIIFIDGPIEQYVNSLKIFTNEIKSNGLLQSNGVVNIRNINDINLFNLDTDTIRINRANTLYGVQYFKDPAIIRNNFTQIFGRINEINLLNDVILLNINKNEPQIISGRKTFERLVLNENAIINGLVNGIPLKLIESNTFYTNGDQRVNSHEIIKGLVEFHSGNNNIAILNNMKVHEEFITLNDNQTIFAELIFNSPLIVNRNLITRGSVSGENLTKLISESLVKDVPQYLTQPIKFDSMVFRQDVKVDEHVDNVDLSALSNTVKKFTRIVNITKYFMESTANRHNYVSDYLYKSMEKSVFEIDHFFLYQVLDEVYGDRIQTHGKGIFSLSSPTAKTSTIHTIKYNDKKELFDSMIVTKKSEFPDSKLFHLNGKEFELHISPLESHNISTQITSSGHLVGSLGYFVSFVDILRTSTNSALLLSLKTDGKLNIFLIESFANNKPSLRQIAESNLGPEITKVVPFLKDNKLYIVVTRNYKMNCMTDNTVNLFVLHNPNTFKLVQRIPLLNVMDVIHFENNGKHYLALSDATPVEESKNGQTIYIYRNDRNSEGCSFSLFQKLEFDNVIQLAAFSFGTINSEQQYIAAANRTQISIWKQEGESGFNTNWLLHTKNTRVFTPISASNNLFIIVGQSYKCHESLIFKAETKGIALAPIIFRSKEN